MKRINFLMSMVALCMLFVSCEDTRLDGIPTNSVYMARSGLQKMTVYDLGESSIIPVSVAKAGYNNVTAEVSIELASQAELDAYNEANTTEYVMLPDDCYAFANVTLNFGPNDLYKTQPLTLDVEAVKTLALANPTKHYAVPVQITKSSLDVNKARAISIMDFTIAPAMVTMSKSGKTDIKLADKGVTEFSFDVSVPFENKWDLDCQMDLSQETFDEFNEMVGNVYEKIPDAAVSFPESVIIPAGKQVFTVIYKIDRDKLEASNYALVLKFKAVVASDPSKVIFVDQNTKMYAGVTSAAVDIPRAGWIATAATADENLIIRAVDGDVATFWQSAWSGQPNIGPDRDEWFQIDMGKSWKLTAVKITNNSYKSTGSILTSLDGVTWDTKGVFSAQQGTGVAVIAPVTPTTCRYFRVKFLTSSSTNAVRLSEIDAQGGAVK